MGWLLAALLSTAWSPAVRTFIPSKPTAACVTSIQRVGVPVAAQGDDGTLQEEIGNAFGAWYDEIRMQGMALGGYPASVVARPVQPWQLRLVFEGRDAFTVLPADATTDELYDEAARLHGIDESQSALRLVVSGAQLPAGIQLSDSTQLRDPQSHNNIIVMATRAESSARVQQ